MRKKHSFGFVFLLMTVFLFALGGVFLNYTLFDGFSIPGLSFTGKVTGTGTATVTQSGAAGITIVDSSVAFGSGYYNATCTTNYATLDSNLTYGDGGAGSVYGSATPYCWVNTTAILGGTGRDAHSLQNNGSVIVNVSAIANLHGEDWLCGGNCPFTSSAGMQLLSYDNEAASCADISNLTSGYATATSANSNVTVGICDRLGYVDSNDTLNVYVNATIPKDATSGAKTLTITYEALAL